VLEARCALTYSLAVVSERVREMISFAQVELHCCVSALESLPMLILDHRRK
jgi:hypothetical protein